MIQDDSRWFKMIQDDSSNSCDSSVHCRMHWKPLYIAVLQLQSELWALEDALVASGGFMIKWHCCELLMGTMNLHESPIKWTQGQIITFKEMPSNLLPWDSSPILALKVKMHCGFSQKSCNHSRASARNMWRNALSKHQHASTRNVRSEKGQRTQPLQPMAWQPKRPTHRHVLLNVGPVPQPAPAKDMLCCGKPGPQYHPRYPSGPAEKRLRGGSTRLDKARWICEVFFTFDTSVVPTKLIQLHNGIVRKTGCLPTSQHKPKLRPPIPFLQPGQVRETWRNLQQCVNLSTSKIKLKCDKFNTTNTTNI